MMIVKHKWAEIIAAFVSGQQVQFSRSINWTTLALTVNDPCWSEQFNVKGLEWRIKPPMPTLGEIAREAWYGDDTMPSAPATTMKWKFAAAAVKKAVELGNYRED